MKYVVMDAANLCQSVLVHAAAPFSEQGEFRVAPTIGGNMKGILGHVIFMTLLGSVVIYGCGGGSSTSPDVVGLTQKNLEGTWERPDGTQYTIDESGNITNMGGGPDQIISFSGRITVLDNEGNVSGTINVDHRHADGQSSHAHPINFTGRFMSSTTLQMNWSVPGAGSGTTTWNKLF